MAEEEYLTGQIYPVPNKFRGDVPQMGRFTGMDVHDRPQFIEFANDDENMDHYREWAQAQVKGDVAQAAWREGLLATQQAQQQEFMATAPPVPRLERAGPVVAVQQPHVGPEHVAPAPVDPAPVAPAPTWGTVYTEFIPGQPFIPAYPQPPPYYPGVEQIPYLPPQPYYPVAEQMPYPPPPQLFYPGPEGYPGQELGAVGGEEEQYEQVEEEQYEPYEAYIQAGPARTRVRTVDLLVDNVKIKQLWGIKTTLDEAIDYRRQLLTLIEGSELVDNIPAIGAKFPTAFVLHIGDMASPKSASSTILTIHAGEPNSGTFYGCVFDRTDSGHYDFTARPITNFGLEENRVLSVAADGSYTYRQHLLPQTGADPAPDSPPRAIRHRVLVVVQAGYLVYFHDDKGCHILVENQMLEFAHKETRLQFRRAYDTKRTDGQEVFLKNDDVIHGSQVDFRGPEVDGMSIFKGAVQRDTARDGTYVVTGDGNAIIDLTQIQTITKKAAGDPEEQTYPLGAQPPDDGYGPGPHGRGVGPPDDGSGRGGPPRGGGRGGPPRGGGSGSGQGGSSGRGGSYRGQGGSGSYRGGSRGRSAPWGGVRGGTHSTYRGRQQQSDRRGGGQ